MATMDTTSDLYQQSGLKNLDDILGERSAPPPCANQHFFGRGKLLLTGEYFVLDGAKSLALPTKAGQRLSVTYRPSFSPTLSWSSYDVNGDLWFKGEFEFWHLSCIDKNPSDKAIFLEKILQQIRKQNPHFLRDNFSVEVETHLGFPIEWGLGSSSSLIYDLAQWAYISAFELNAKTLGGSGYDIACAGGNGPLTYEIKSKRPAWGPVSFNPSFKENIYFIYQGEKKCSREGIKYYKSQKEKFGKSVYQSLTEITEKILTCQTLKEFEFLIDTHEDIIASNLLLPKLKDECFGDYWGSIKSLGAWGGDFAMVTSDRSELETLQYFTIKGIDVFLPFSDLIEMGTTGMSEGAL